MSKRFKHASGESLRCSFCHKSQDVVGKIISNPSDYPRAYICDECIMVCNSILEDDRPVASPRIQHTAPAFGLLAHPMAPEFFAALEQWITLAISGQDATTALESMKKIAVQMMELDASLNEGPS